MDTAFMRKTFALIAKGLIEKEQLLQTEPTRYPYSKALQHGINMFLAASQWAGSQAAVEYPDEASFLAHFITRPVEEWFDTWESGAVEQLHLQEEPFYAYDAFAYQKAGNAYVPSSDCYEFLETQDSDIMNGTDERILYEKIIALSQEDYCIEYFRVNDGFVIILDIVLRNLAFIDLCLFGQEVDGVGLL